MRNKRKLELPPEILSCEAAPSMQPAPVPHAIALQQIIPDEIGSPILDIRTDRPEMNNREGKPHDE